ncbi:MAG: hypothetical protein ABSB19_10240 [Methylomonas sp.]|jgi:hypothetical protein
MEKIKFTLSLKFKIWVLIGLLATAGLTFADVLNNLTPSSFPLAVAAWLFLAFIMGGLALHKRDKE